MKKRLLLLASLLGILLFALPKSAQAQIAIADVNDNYLAAGLIHQKYTAWNAVRDHVISGATQNSYGYGHSQYHGQAPCDRVLDCMPAVGCKKNKPHSAWSNYIGRDSRYQSFTNGDDWRIGSNGVQLGTDILRKRNNQFGAFFGYEDSTALNTGDSVNANDYYVGLYDVHVFRSGVDFRTVFSFGWQDFISQRNRLGNVYETPFRGVTSELNVELGKRFYSNGHHGGWSMRPVVGLDWHFQRLGGAREAPNDENALRYHGTDLAQFLFRFGSDIRYERGAWAVETGLYYSYDLRGGDLIADVSDSLTDRFRSALESSNLGRSVFSVNVSGSYQVSRNITAFIGYRGEAIPDQAGRGYASTGYVGGAWRW
jgi:hypothetical protein